MRVQPFAGTAFFLVLLAGCNQLPGTPKPGVEVPRPDSITDFATLQAAGTGPDATARLGTEARPSTLRFPFTGLG